MKFKTVEDYYLYMSQGNTFAPRFGELTEVTKQKWIDDFNKQITNK